jgi:hypothetical protein
VSVLCLLALLVGQPGYYRIAKAPFDQVRPAAAWSDGLFLVAWADYRDSIIDTTSANTYVGRITPDGRAMDSSGICLEHTRTDDRTPRVCPAPDGWLVVWRQGC